MVKVSYTVKDQNGYLIDKTIKFDQMKEAFAFIHSIKNSSVGKPLLERL